MDAVVFGQLGMERGGEDVIAADRDRMPLPGGEHLGFLDVTARRNAFGRQLQSFEADLEVTGAGDEPLRAVFIRAPWVERTGDGVEVLASWEGHPVAVRGEGVLASSFHPELTDDPRFHAIFMAMVTKAKDLDDQKEQARG